MDKQPGQPPDPNDPADPTAEAFGDGLPDPQDPASQDQSLPIDKVIEDIQGPDIHDPDHTFLPE